MSYNKESRVLITGAAMGLGKGMAENLAGKVGKLILWDLDIKGLGILQQALGGESSGVFVQKVDLSEEGEILVAAKEVLKLHGGIDLLINNAGIVVGKPFVDHTVQDIQKTLSVNTLALLYTTRLFLPGMLERKNGHICNIVSSAGLATLPGMAAYVSSKFGAFGFSDALRIELKTMKAPVKVTTVTPYYINTGMFQGVKALLPLLSPEKVVRKILKGIEKEKKIVSMPVSYHFIRICQGLLPSAVYEWIMGSVLGIYNSMDSFKGRK
jgi:all-trans-retinol dehydrogenase (NAD+)